MTMASSGITNKPSESSKTTFIKKEIKIIEEIVNILSKPTKYDILENGMFIVFNSSSSMLENIINGPKLTNANNSEISTKMIDFQNLVSLGQLLADKRNIVKTNGSSFNQSINTIKIVQETLSSHVYINHVITPASIAAVSAATAAASSSSPVSSTTTSASSDRQLHSWWNIINTANKPIRTLDPKGTKETTNMIISSTNPLESHDYFPDLRLVLKNVLVLFISFFKRYEELLNGITDNDNVATLIKTLRDLLILLNVSILNKLVEIFKMLNPNLKLNTQNDIYYL